jgi:hypothetical protein
MKNLIVCIAVLVFINMNAHENWGKTGHRTIAEIANHYLSEKAKSKIKLILHGKSMAVASTFADEIKSDDLYDEFKVWHYANANFDETYQESNKNEDGDIVVGIQHCINVLKDSRSDEDDQEFYLKMLIHLIGDLHQPLHLGLKEDRGGNDIEVDWFGENSNLHRIWDTEMISTYGMSYTEMAKNKAVFTPDDLKNFADGNLLDWVEDIRKLTKEIYNSVEQREKLGYRYMYDWYETLDKQLHIAGIRLAKILNDIYA